MGESSLIERTTRRAVLESARLQALQPFQMFDAETLEAFERLAAYAAGVVSADMAALGFVDESSVFLAGAYGLESRRLERVGSFFDTLARSGDPLLVSDARRDQRFCDHALVAGPHALRAFAGAPILDGNGMVLGAIGAMARRPHAFATQTLSDLSALARSLQRYLAELPDYELAPETVQGWLGIRTVPAAMGRGRGGLIVVSVARGGPAEQAGVRPTDVLETIDGVAVHRPADVVAAMAGRRPGTVALLRLQRGGERLECYTAVESQRPSLFSRR